MRVLFIGQDGFFSTLPLRTIAAEHEIVGIVESVPQKYTPIKAGIKRILARRSKKTTLKYLAGQLSVPYLLLQRSVANNLASFVVELSPDIICVASMSQLLPKEVFSIPPYGAINFHPALLPKYRGPRPLFWPYYFMEPEAGVTIHYIDEGEDTGDIIKQKSVPIALGMPGRKLVNDIIIAGAALMAEALGEISKGVAQRIPQKHLPCPFRARRYREDEELVDWNWPIERIWHFLRGTAYQDNNFPRMFPGLSWMVTEFKKGAADGASGQFHWGLQGCYLAHREGKLFMKPNWSLGNFFRDLYHFFLKLAGKE